MRIYELVFIAKPDLAEEDLDGVVDLVKQTIEAGGGAIEKTDKWGKRRLAYRVQKYWDGFYVLVQYTTGENQDLPKEIERRLRVTDHVIKFLTVRIDEDLKKLEKLKAQRDAVPVELIQLAFDDRGNLVMHLGREQRVDRLLDECAVAGRDTGRTAP